MSKIKYGLLSISDFAAYCGTTRQTLQYYDHIGLLKPAQIGMQGYRYYNPLQGHEFRMIHTLRRSGCSLSEVESIIHASSYDMLQQQLVNKQERLQSELEQIRREQIFLQRTEAITKWFLEHSKTEPQYLELKQDYQMFAFPFPKPCNLYEKPFFETLYAYADYCRSNSHLQQYPYCYYLTNRELLSSSKKYSRILSLPGDNSENSGSFRIPAGGYVFLRTSPDMELESRNESYETLFRYAASIGMELRAGGIEMPIHLPLSLEDGQRFYVLYVLSVKPKEKER